MWSERVFEGKFSTENGSRIEKSGICNKHDQVCIALQLRMRRTFAAHGITFYIISRLHRFSVWSLRCKQMASNFSLWPKLGA